VLNFACRDFLSIFRDLLCRFFSVFKQLWQRDSWIIVRKIDLFGWKKLRGVSPSSYGNKGLCIVNARGSENRVCVGEKKKYLEKMITFISRVCPLFSISKCENESNT
jgi:hypothetical protein